MKFDFVDFLPEKNIISLKSKDKKAALGELIDFAAQISGCNRKKLFDAVWAREEQLSTGLGLGLALPHARLRDFGEPLVIIALCQTPIEDYEGLDNSPVEMIILIITDDEDRSRYLSILKSVSSNLLKNKELINKLFTAKNNPAEVIKLLKD
jgi:mannitol/fructose-specific phosphotransferase system IIA component (Ntr-type)